MFVFILQSSKSNIIVVIIRVWLLLLQLCKQR